VARDDLGLQFRPAVECDRCPGQPAAPQDRRLLRDTADPHDTRRRLYPFRQAGIRQHGTWKRMICFLRRLWNSISFRLTLNYGLLAILTTLILSAFIYTQFIGALRTEYTRQITSTAQRLEVAYEEGGRNALAAAIEL